MSHTCASQAKTRVIRADMVVKACIVFSQIQTFWHPNILHLNILPHYPPRFEEWSVRVKTQSNESQKYLEFRICKHRRTSRGRFWRYITLPNVVRNTKKRARSLNPRTISGHLRHVRVCQRVMSHNWMRHVYMYQSVVSTCMNESYPHVSIRRVHMYQEVMFTSITNSCPHVSITYVTHLDDSFSHISISRVHMHSCVISSHIDESCPHVSIPRVQ